MAATTGTDRTVLVGRDQEIEALRECLARSLAGNGSLVLVSGQAGIGKTSLVQAIAEEAEEQGALVLTGAAYDLTSTPPYGPWTDLLARYQPADDLPEVPEVLKRGTGMGDVTSQVGLFEVARELMAAIAAVKPLMVAVEDIHWSDPASLGLLRYLARFADQHRLLIVATYRDDEITPEHHLFQLLPALSRESNVTRVNLRPIGGDGIRSLIESRYEFVPRDVSRLVDYMRRQSEGNPLYFWELLRTLEEGGRFYEQDGTWRLGDLSQVRVPSLLLQVIERRLDRVGGENRNLLEIAAVIGPWVDLDVWQEVSGASDERIEEIVDQATGSNLLTVDTDGVSVAFSHALVREAIYQRMSIVRRRRLHRELADLMIDQGDPVEDAVAHHLQQAGDERAADWWRKAGERARRTYAIQTAAERFAQAAELLDGKRDRRVERGWLLYSAARQLRFADPERGIDYFNESERIAIQAGERVLEAFSVADRGFNRSAAGQLQESLDDIERGNELIDSLPADYIQSEFVRNRVADVVASSPDLEMADQGFLERLGRFNPRLPVLVLSYASKGLLRKSVELGEPYREAIASIDNPDHHLLSPLADVCNGLALAWSQLGEPDKAREAFTEAYDSMVKINHLAFLAPVLYGLLEYVVLPYETDELAERKRLESLAYEAATSAHEAMLTESPEEVTNFKLLWIEGRWDEAQQRFQLGVYTIFRNLRRQFLVAVGNIARARGNAETAHEFVSHVLPQDTATRPMESELHAALDGMQLAADLAFDAGDPERVAAWIDRYERWLEWSGAVRGRAELTMLRARQAHLRGELDQALAYADSALNHASDPRQPLALIEIRRGRGRLFAADGQHDPAEDELTESLRLAEDCAAPFEAALTRLELAELLIASGRTDGALALIREARTTCEELDARPALKRAEDLAERLLSRSPADSGLTRRETEVLRLVALGYSDPQIAEELFISRRTVNTHLTSIFRKLDVSSRTSAALIARERDLI